MAKICVKFSLNMQCGEDKKSPPRGEEDSRDALRRSPWRAENLRRWGPRTRLTHNLAALTHNLAALTHNLAALTHNLAQKTAQRRQRACEMSPLPFEAILCVKIDFGQRYASPNFD